jgi:hypothetical protein
LTVSTVASPIASTYASTYLLGPCPLWFQPATAAIRPPGVMTNHPIRAEVEKVKQADSKLEWATSLAVASDALGYPHPTGRTR